MVWYLVLWGIFSWSIFEQYYPLTDYGPTFIYLLFAVLPSFLLLGVTGLPLCWYFKRRTIGRKGALVLAVLFVVVTASLSVYLFPHLAASAENKAKAQWYINYLRSQGFDAEYGAKYPYGH